MAGPEAAPPLEWDAPAGCPAADVVEARIQGLLGARVSQSSAKARIRIRPTPRGWHAEIDVDWRGHADRRALDAEDCDSLAEATALLVAVMADPLQAVARLDAATSEDQPGPAPIDAAAVPARPEPRPRDRGSASAASTPRADAAAARSPSSTEGTASSPSPSAPRGSPLARGPAATVGVLVDGGSLPRVTPAPLLGLAWRGPRIRGLVEGFVLPPRRVRSSAAEAQRARVMVGAVRLGACARFGPGRVEIPLCAAAEVGGAWATGFGRTGQGRAADPWVAMLGRTGLVVPMGRWLAASAGLEMAAVLRVIEYRVEGELLHRTGPIALRGLLGLDVRIPSQRSARPENQ